MPRPVVGIYATVEPASWGPWTDRPSALVPAALGEAVRRAGGMVVLIAPDPGLERVELLRTLDALIVFEALVDAGHLDALLRTAREVGLEVLVLEASRVAPASAVEDFEREIRGLAAL